MFGDVPTEQRRENTQWRDVMPHVADRGRRVAPDLIGTGDSAKLPSPPVFSHTCAQHRQDLDASLDAVVPEGRLTLAIHDRGSALGFDSARPHRLGPCCCSGATAAAGAAATTPGGR